MGRLWCFHGGLRRALGALSYLGETFGQGWDRKYSEEEGERNKALIRLLSAMALQCPGVRGGFLWFDSTGCERRAVNSRSHRQAARLDLPCGRSFCASSAPCPHDRPQQRWALAPEGTQLFRRAEIFHVNFPETRVYLISPSKITFALIWFPVRLLMEITLER